MVIHDKFVFLHLQKCAGIFTRNFLCSIFPDAVSSMGHVGLDHKRVMIDPGDRFTLGNIRNPWDWYVSFYAYRKQQTERHPHYKQLFIDNPSFKTLMKRLLNYRHGRKRIHNINFQTMRQQDVGVYTLWYDQVFSVYPTWVNRVENLTQDLIDCFDKNGLPLDGEQIRRLRASEQLNTSKHKHYSEYYDKELRQLVAHKSRHIIERYGYEFES